MKSSTCFAVLAGGLITAVRADIHGVSLGAAAPPATLGGYVLTPYAIDLRLNEPVNDASSLIPSQNGGQDLRHLTTFSAPVQATDVGAGWLSWSHGYAGDVYWTDAVSSLDLELSLNTLAFVFYVQPNEYDLFDVLVTGTDGLGTFSLAESLDGFEGAQGFGFYATGDSRITGIRIEVDPAATGFALGEFSAAVIPEAGTNSAMILVAGLGAMRLRRRRGDPGHERALKSANF